MRAAPALLVFLMLAASAFAAVTYNVSNDALATRDVVKECTQVLNTITNTPKTECKTKVSISISNARSTTAREAAYSEAIPMPLANASASLPSFCTLNNSVVSCRLSEMNPGAGASFSYEIGAWVDNAPSMFQAPSVQLIPVLASLKAPSKTPVGGIVLLELRSLSGQPVADAEIEVQGPASVFKLKTNSAGLASFTANNEGFYAYSLTGDSVAFAQAPSATNSEKEAIVVSAAALSAAEQQQATQAVSNALPLFLAFSLLVLIVLLWGFYFYATKSKEEEVPKAPAAPSTPTQQPPPSWPTYEPPTPRAPPEKREEPVEIKPSQIQEKPPEQAEAEEKTPEKTEEPISPVQKNEFIDFTLPREIKLDLQQPAPKKQEKKPEFKEAEKALEEETQEVEEADAEEEKRPPQKRLPSVFRRRKKVSQTPSRAKKK